MTRSTRMEAELLNLLQLHWLEPGPMAFESELLLAGGFFLATAILLAFGVPGVLVPMALSSGALIGIEAAAIVALGAVAGSQILFLLARRFAGEGLRAKLGTRFEHFQERFAAHGILYVIALRLIGAPHFLVTGGSALMPIRASSFAAATLIGFLPAVAIAAATGSAI